MKFAGAMEDYGSTLPRPLVERLTAASPHVKGYGMMQRETYNDQYLVDNKEYSLNLVYGIRDFVSVFKPTVACGLSSAPTRCRRPA